MQLFKNNKPHIKRNKTQMSGQVHEDVMNQISDRKEPMELAIEQDQGSRVAKLPDDPSTDPEGAARRADSAEAYPPFILQDYKLSKTNYWGKVWPDKLEHLIPKNSLVAAVMQVAKDSEKNYGGMLALATGKDNIGNFNLIKNAYTCMIAGVDDQFKFPLMRALGNLTNQALAERAFQKYMYMQAASRHEEGKDEPEWMLGMKDRMIKASAIAGTYVMVHGECWTMCEYKNSPSYMLDNEIKLRLTNNAKFLEDRFGDKPRALPTVADHLAVALNC